jgi:hypothetical protein
MIGFLVADAQHVWMKQPTQLDMRQEEADGRMYLLHERPESERADSWACA